MRNSGSDRCNAVSEELFVPAIEEDRVRFVSGLTGQAEQSGRLKSFITWLGKNKSATTAVAFLIIITAAAVFGPLLSPYTYLQQIHGYENIPPFRAWAHPLGTDGLGRDMMVRLLYGTRISLFVSITAIFATVVIGVVYGAAAGFIGGAADALMMRAVDVLYSVPSVLIVILLEIVLKAPLTWFFSRPPFQNPSFAGLTGLVIAFALIYWVDMARIVRGQVILLKQTDYAAAAKTLGADNARILVSHILPNCVGVISVTAMQNVPSAVFNEAFLSFIGLGVPAPMTSLGSLANDGMESIYSCPYLLIMPSVLICLLLLLMNIAGDALRDVFDPYGFTQK